MGAASGVERLGADLPWRRASTIWVDQVSGYRDGLIAEVAFETCRHAGERRPFLSERTHQASGFVGLVSSGMEERVANTADHQSDASNDNEADDNASRAAYTRLRHG